MVSSDPQEVKEQDDIQIEVGRAMLERHVDHPSLREQVPGIVI